MLLNKISLRNANKSFLVSMHPPSLSPFAPTPTATGNNQSYLPDLQYFEVYQKKGAQGLGDIIVSKGACLACNYLSSILGTICDSSILFRSDPSAESQEQVRSTAYCVPPNKTKQDAHSRYSFVPNFLHSIFVCVSSLILC